MGDARMGDAHTGEGGDRQTGSDTPGDGDAALKARLAKLGSELDRLKGEDQRRTAAAARSSGDAQGIARGFRLSTEFVAAVIVGGGLGWVLDRSLGSTPWGLIVFLMLGFAAGVTNVMRAAGVSNGPRSGPPTAGAT